jgi:hydroxymethylpyrimidine/phosphomethylpyrimidine kinase
LTSVVAEVPAKVESIQLLPAEMIAAQIRVLMEAFPVVAAKTGMLGGREQIAAVVKAWRPMAERDIPLVIDPVMVATSGGRLIEEDAVQVMVQELFPMAYLITPNMDEAAALLGVAIQSREDMQHAALALAEEHDCAILLKGGHLSGDDAPDVLVHQKSIHWLEGRRIHGVHTHGTGCTYSAAITAGLGRGLPLHEAVIEGKKFVTQAIADYFRWMTKAGGLDALNHRALSIQVGRL